MKVVTVIGGKGGGGKTTTLQAIALGMVAAGKRVVMYDLDRNSQITLWKSASKEYYGENELEHTWSENLVLVSPDGIDDMYEDMKVKAAEGYEYAMLDTAGGTDEIVQTVFTMSNLVIVPVAPQGKDENQMRLNAQFIQMMQEEMEKNPDSKPVDWGVVLIMASPKSARNKNERTDIERIQQYPHYATEIPKNEAFKNISRYGIFNNYLDAKKQKSAVPPNFISEAQIVCDQLAQEIIEDLEDK